MTTSREEKVRDTSDKLKRRKFCKTARFVFEFLIIQVPHSGVIHIPVCTTIETKTAGKVEENTRHAQRPKLARLT